MSTERCRCRVEDKPEGCIRHVLSVAHCNRHSESNVAELERRLALSENMYGISRRRLEELDDYFDRHPEERMFKDNTRQTVVTIQAEKLKEAKVRVERLEAAGEKLAQAVVDLEGTAMQYRLGMQLAGALQSWREAKQKI